jgi:hypothetical protein
MGKSHPFHPMGRIAFFKYSMGFVSFFFDEMSIQDI